MPKSLTTPPAIARPPLRQLEERFAALALRRRKQAGRIFVESRVARRVLPSIAAHCRRSRLLSGAGAICFAAPTLRSSTTLPARRADQPPRMRSWVAADFLRGTPSGLVFIRPTSTCCRRRQPGLVFSMRCAAKSTSTTWVCRSSRRPMPPTTRRALNAANAERKAPATRPTPPSVGAKAPSRCGAKILCDRLPDDGRTR